MLALLSALLVVPILVNYDAPGFRWLMLHIPIVQSMSVMLRFWFAYIPFLCVLTPLLMDYLVPNASHRNWWCAAAVAFTIIQCGATDMTYYTSAPER